MTDFFGKIIDFLNHRKLPYMLSGSVAMSLYILPRATKDFDFIINVQQQDASLFADHFSTGYYCDKDSIADAIKNHQIFNIIDYASGFKADFVILKSSAYRQEEFNRRRQMNYFGKNIFVVTPEDLLISKLIWIQDLQSGLQMEDIRKLKQVDNLDRKYMNHWIENLNLNTFNLLS